MTKCYLHSKRPGLTQDNYWRIFVMLLGWLVDSASCYRKRSVRRWIKQVILTNQVRQVNTHTKNKFMN